MTSASSHYFVLKDLFTSKAKPIPLPMGEISARSIPMPSLWFCFCACGNWVAILHWVNAFPPFWGLRVGKAHSKFPHFELCRLLLSTEAKFLFLSLPGINKKGWATSFLIIDQAVTVRMLSKTARHYVSVGSTQGLLKMKSYDWVAV